MIDSLLSNTKSSLGPIYEGTLVKHGKYVEMHLPTSRSHSYKFLNSNICLVARLELIGNSLSYTMAHELYRKGIQCKDYI